MLRAEEDEYYLESATVRAFIAEVRRIVAEEAAAAVRVRRVRPAFEALLGDQQWLPEGFRHPTPAGGMGPGVANYLLYRSATGDLSLSALVLAPGAGTPVHDHLAWGLVGLYSGSQDEWVYRRVDDGQQQERAVLAIEERRSLVAGDFYDLLPPDGDIHRVQATGSIPSISLHLLGNDIGCIWRHRFEPEAEMIQPFRSSYTNQPCP
jgi:predicted metal-dependent enzyme (double-stranded beta helix superfamily)